MAVTRTEMLGSIRRIAGAVAVPLNADLEAGYGDTPEQVAETVRLAIAAGAAGCNIEDVDIPRGGLFEEGTAVARIAAARQAIDSSGCIFVLTARTDAFLHGSKSAMQDAIQRGNRFLEAGADCVFTPGVTDIPRARTLAQELTGPLNLVAGLNDASASTTALIDVGVKRISVGGSIARSVLGLVRRSARELRERGTVSYAAQQIPQTELNALFARAMLERMTSHSK
jgi:2-methylisocitrate lyase-like PEP mutase family enzyme